MIYKNLGADHQLPAIGLGTWEMGGREAPEVSQNHLYIDSIQFALSKGLTHIDTAAYYGNGQSEIIVGQAIQAFNRPNVFITTKVWHTQLRKNDLLASAYKSIERLKTNYIDLLLIHFPNPDVPHAESMEALNLLVEQKLVKHIGVSNYSVTQLQDAMRYSSSPIEANQIEYSLNARNAGLYTQNMESEIIPFCLQNNILVIAWRPLGKGKLLQIKPTDLLGKLALKYAKTPAQIALNWVASKPGVITIPKATSQMHIIENAQAVDWSLSAQDILALELEYTS
jgi:diketogulonate reductase-like aldo/keto reductase